ncbi:helix-turn-helix domain-containing protein [Flavobacterium sp.]|uniref:helix-turn-helix domain-containing protein n=1 Tax=Flavobacterium sp. TaxID=239 RepID=UPI001224EBA0|nr:helix-turn-helix domain-containing protein [Flavobacterium sp.]RZJ71732.1 MAG: helix-turn-helix domain-containing protein [Flavobacterium sp.]
MHDENHYQRIRQLYRMLFELSTGNLGFRIAKDSQDDIGKLSDSLNTFAAQMQLSLRKSGQIQPFYTYQNVTYAAFLLDSQLLIVACSDNAITLLHSSFALIKNQPFANLLTPASKKVWQQLQFEIRNAPASLETVRLEFEIDGQHIQPAFCSISKLIESDQFLVSTVTTLLHEIAEINQNAKAPVNDTALAQNLYRYILDNLDKPLPTLTKLASHFNTNEYKLKDNFRLFFNTSIYQFYNEERLKRAHMIIEQTDITLKAVAIMSGFNDYITFLKAFRKKFGYTPSSVNRSKD